MGRYIRKEYKSPTVFGPNPLNFGVDQWSIMIDKTKKPLADKQKNMIHLQKIKRVYETGNQTIHALNTIDLSIGAFIGIFFGLLLAFVIQQFAGWPAGWSMMAVVLSVSICLVTGVVFGWYPARQAAALDPIRALHAE